MQSCRWPLVIAALATLAVFAVLLYLTAWIADHRAERRRQAEKRRVEDLHRYHHGSTGVPPL